MLWWLMTNKGVIYITDQLTQRFSDTLIYFNRNIYEIHSLGAILSYKWNLYIIETNNFVNAFYFELCLPGVQVWNDDFFPPKKTC